MLLRSEYLSQDLDRPLPTKDGGILRTIRDACNYMTGIGKQRELRGHWQWTCKLILAKEDVLTVSRALELALFMDAKLDVSRVPAFDSSEENKWSGSSAACRMSRSMTVCPSVLDVIKERGSSPTLTLVFENRSRTSGSMHWPTHSQTDGAPRRRLGKA
jgi:hypothetical protein